MSMAEGPRAAIAGDQEPKARAQGPCPALARRGRLDHKARLLEVNVMRSHAKLRLNEEPGQAGPVARLRPQPATTGHGPGRGRPAAGHDHPGRAGGDPPPRSRPAGGPIITPCTGLRSSGRSTTRSPPSCCAMPRRSEPPTRTRPCRPPGCRPAGSRPGSRPGPARASPWPARAREARCGPGSTRPARSPIRRWTTASSSGDVWMVVTATLLVARLLLLGAAGLARRMLDRRRMRAWEAEWRTNGPLWSRHRS
jgi:hypothetical protein